jgi:hypothetical protein
VEVAAVADVGGRLPEMYLAVARWRAEHEGEPSPDGASPLDAQMAADEIQNIQSAQQRRRMVAAYGGGWRGV